MLTVSRLFVRLSVFTYLFETQMKSHDEREKERDLAQTYD